MIAGAVSVPPEHHEHRTFTSADERVRAPETHEANDFLVLAMQAYIGTIIAMSRNLASFAALAFFASLLVGTSKAPTGTSTGSSASTATVTVPTMSAAPTALHTVTITKPAVQMTLPSKWRADPFPDGISFSVTAPPDSNANFDEPKVSPAAQIADRMKQWDRLHLATVFLHEEDVVLARVKYVEHPFIEGVICGKVGTKDYCTTFMEADPPGGTAEADARALLQVARSMRAP